MTHAPPPTGPHRRTLHAQFVQLLLLPLVVAFLLASFVTVWISYSAELAQQQQQRGQTLDIYSHSLSKPLWDCDSATARGIVETLAHVPTVMGVRLQDICAGNNLELGLVLRDSSSHPDWQQTAVVHHDELGRSFTVGYLQVQFHPLSMASAALDGLWRHLAIFGAMLAVMLAGAALVFRRIIGRPLARFRSAILAHRTLGSGEALGSPLSPQRNDELADVMHAYDALMVELQSRFKRQATLAHSARRLLATAAPDQRPLHDVLTSVLHTTQAHRVYLAENSASSDGVVYAHIHALVGQPLEPHHPAYLPSHQPYAPALARWQRFFEQRDPLLATTQDLPAPEAQWLQAHGVRSVAALPVWGHQQWYGYLCVQDLQNARSWSDSECIFLQTVADMLGAFLEGESHTRALDSAIEQLRNNESELRRLARHDPLTGLGNRVVLEENLAQAVQRAVDGGRHGYVLLLDLDGFKPINDTHGHGMGDQVLQALSRRLLASVRSTDTVARLGGDEFVIVIDAQDSPPQLLPLLDKLTAAIEAPLQCAGRILHIGVSIGAARFPEDGNTSLALLAHADQKMYRAKQHKQARDKASGSGPGVS